VQAVHAGIGMDVWAVGAQTARLIEEALALGDELSLSVRQGMPLRFTRHQVRAAFTTHAMHSAAIHCIVARRRHPRVQKSADVVMRATQVEGMLPSEYLPLWREYVAAFGELLEPALRDPGFPAAQRLVRAREARCDHPSPSFLTC